MAVASAHATAMRSEKLPLARFIRVSAGSGAEVIQAPGIDGSGAEVILAPGIDCGSAAVTVRGGLPPEK